MATPLKIAYAGFLLTGMSLAGVFGTVAWRRRPSREATALVVLAAGIVLWLVGTTASLFVDPLSARVFAQKFSYFGIVSTTPAFLVLTLLYTGREAWVDRRLLGVLSVEPVVFLIGLWTTPELVYESVSVTGSSLAFDVVHGPLFWVHVVYAYVLTLIATALLLEFLYRTQYLYTKQVLALLTAVAAPWFGNMLYLGGAVPFDPTPITFAVSGTVLTWAVLEAGFVDLSPIAREAVVDHVNHGMLVVDEEGRLIDLNPTGKAMLDADDDIGRPLAELLTDYPQLVEEFADAHEKRENVLLDTPEGRRVFDIEVTPLTDYRDRLQGRLFLIQDVTERWQREQELQRQNEQLDRFASVVSHDLRNPLNVLDGYVELARESGDTEPLDAAAESIDRMYQLIDDVLSLAREGRQIESREPVELRAVARDAWANLETTEATLIVVDDRTLHADRSRLVQALENLFCNAVEHGGPGVTVEVGTSDDERGFYVQDDGPGIPPDEHDDVFEYGYTTTDEGTGLGLAIADAIAEAHGWELRLEDGSTGARFEFRDANVKRDDSVVLAE
ncbi:PAS domain-containing sensor histidine kinase [Halobacteriales archaeon QS_1_68_20]|nr:MAG: PAS domain-containing sensor histidine kinase [Halobacteriales archaeon QS_1_68_20]